MGFTFDERIEHLLQFEADHGHLFVPTSFSTNGLGRWVTNARFAYCKSKLKQEQIDKLENIGFAWVVPKGEAKAEFIEWGKQFSWLVKYQKSTGRCNVPSKIAGKVAPVAAWCDEQRRLHLDGKLDKSKCNKLSRLGFDFYGSSSEDEPVRLSLPPLFCYHA